MWWEYSNGFTIKMQNLQVCFLWQVVAIKYSGIVFVLSNLKNHKKMIISLHFVNVVPITQLTINNNNPNLYKHFFKNFFVACVHIFFKCL